MEKTSVTVTSNRNERFFPENEISSILPSTVLLTLLFIFHADSRESSPEVTATALCASLFDLRSNYQLASNLIFYLRNGEPVFYDELSESSRDLQPFTLL